MTRRGATRAAVYTRISSDREGEALGVERQRTDCLHLVERNGWTALHDGQADTFTDNDISGGKDETERPAFGRLVEAIRSGQVDAVVAYSQARIYRDTAEFLVFLQLCKESGVETVALLTDADINPSGSLFVATIIAAKDAEERRRISELVERKQLELAQDGKYHGGSRPFGFKKDGVSHDPVEAELIREAASRTLLGESLHTIRRDWQERGIKTTTGRTRWSVSTLKRVLTSPRVAGLRQHQAKILEGVKTAWEPILDRETWEQVRVVLTDPKRFTGPRTQSYPLTGILTCALCGELLKAMPRQGVRCYGCKKESGGCGRIHVRSEAIEKFVFGVILPLADMPDVRNTLRSEKEGGAEAARELVLANAEDERMLNQLSDDYADRIMDRPTYLKQRQRLRERIDAREAQMTTLRGTTALSRFGGEIQSSWSDTSAEDKRSIIKSLVDEIQVDKAPTPGSNRFDPDRLNFVFRRSIAEQAKKDVGIALTRMRVRIKVSQLGDERRKRRITPEPDFEGIGGGFDGSLEEMSASRAKRFFPDIEDGFEDLWPHDTPEALYEGD